MVIMTRIHRPIVAVLMLISAGAATGCASGRRVDTGSLLGTEAPAESALKASAAFPERAREGKTTWSDRAGADDFVRIAEPAGDPDSWLVRDERGGEPLVENLYQLSPKGDVVLIKSTDHGERVITWFSPPLVVMPKELKPDVPFKQKLKIQVFPIHDPDTMKDQGEATQELRLDVQQVIATGDEKPTSTVRVRAVFTVDLSAADVVKTTEQWFETGEDPAGLVAERSEEVVKVLGLAVRTTRRFLVREGR